jgi:polyisoprenoid-binding protein YceI
VPVTVAGNVASGRFTLQRLAFGIGSGEWADTSMVADDVKVQFKLQLAGLRP